MMLPKIKSENQLDKIKSNNRDSKSNNSIKSSKFYIEDIDRKSNHELLKYALQEEGHSEGNRSD
jgi:hypothetical protein